MKSIFSFWWVLSCSWLLWACEPAEPPQPDVCGEVLDLGSFDLLPDSKGRLPYQSVEILIFRDSAGNEYPINRLENSRESIIVMDEGLPCPNDSSQEIEYQYELFQRKLDFRQPERDLRVNYRPWTLIRVDSINEYLLADVMFLQVEDQDSCVLSFLDRRNGNDLVDFSDYCEGSVLDSISLANRTFYLVQETIFPYQGGNLHLYFEFGDNLEWLGIRWPDGEVWRRKE